MAPKPPPRPVLKVGFGSTDWSMTLHDDRSWPVAGGANSVRIGQVAALSRHHWLQGEAFPTPNGLFVRTWDRQSHASLDALVLQRYMDDWMPDAILATRRSGVRVINDLDDWFWGLHPDNNASTAVDPELHPRSNIDHYRRTLEASDLVTVSTPFLADRLAEWDIPAVVIENGVTVERFFQRTHRPGVPFIGWTGSTGHRSNDLAEVAPALQAVQREFRFHHTGDHPAHVSFAEKTGLPEWRVDVLPLLTPEEWPYGFTFDIGIAPLSDHEFNHAKSWIKVIEYMAAGIPWVASDRPEYRRLHEAYGVGRLASSTDEWIAHFRELADPEVRSAEAKRQYDVVAEHLTAKRMAKQWDSLLWDESS